MLIFVSFLTLKEFKGVQTDPRSNYENGENRIKSQCSSNPSVFNEFRNRPLPVNFYKIGSCKKGAVYFHTPDVAMMKLVSICSGSPVIARLLAVSLGAPRRTSSVDDDDGAIDKFCTFQSGLLCLTTDFIDEIQSISLNFLKYHIRHQHCRLYFLPIFFNGTTQSGLYGAIQELPLLPLFIMFLFMKMILFRKNFRMTII